VIPDGYILERRARVLRELPHMLPAGIVMLLTSEDLAQDDPEDYWTEFDATLDRIERNLGSPKKPGE
jgi:hypothetical protein